MKKLLIIAFALINIFNSKAQEFANDKKASMISGAFSYNDETVNYKGYKNYCSNVNIALSYNYFVRHRLFIGSSLLFSSISQSSSYSSDFGIQPQIGCTFGKANSKSFPYIVAAYEFCNSKDNNPNGTIKGDGYSLGAGVIVSLKNHFGISVEANYHMFKFNNKVLTNVFSIDIGFVGLLFKQPKVLPTK